MTVADAKDGQDKLVESLLAIRNDRYEIWKHFEERADRLNDQLWKIGIWLLSVLATTLFLPFLVPSFIDVSRSAFPIQVKAQVPVALIAASGTSLCVYAHTVLLDIRRHIEHNWRRSAYARTGVWRCTGWRGRKRHAWNVLVSIEILALAAFVALFVLALAQ
jgi:Ca2+/H+ antiporter